MAEIGLQSYDLEGSRDLDTVDVVTQSNIDRTFSKIFQCQKTIIQASDKHIVNYVTKKNQLLINRVTKAFLKKGSRY